MVSVWAALGALKSALNKYILLFIIITVFFLISCEFTLE